MRRLLVIGGLCLWGAGCSLVLVTGGPPSADDGGPMRPGDGGAGMIVDADVDGGEDPDGGDDAALDAEVRDARPDEGVDGTVRDAEMDMGGSPSADLGPDAVADEGIADGAPADAVPDGMDVAGPGELDSDRAPDEGGPTDGARAWESRVSVDSSCAMLDPGLDPNEAVVHGDGEVQGHAGARGDI